MLESDGIYTIITWPEFRLGARGNALVAEQLCEEKSGRSLAADNGARV